METGIQKAVRLAGNQTALANRLGISPQAVQKWVEQGFVPADRCRPIETEFGGAVTRYELNREIFGDPPQEPSEPAPADQLPYTTPDGEKAREAKGAVGRQEPKLPN